MNMRKIIAVLSAALLLCAAIPMSALTVVAAPGDVIIDADFNDGMDGFNNHSVIDGALVIDGTSADWANSFIYAGFKPGVKYQVTFSAKADAPQSLGFKINNGWAGTNVSANAALTTEYAEYELFLTPDANLVEPIFTIQTNTEAPNGTIFYIDWVKVVEYKEPAVPGKIVNGDFETGDFDGWEHHQSTAISTDAHSGSYAANVKGDGGWGGMLNQDIPVEAGKTYEISLWVKTIANGANIQIQDGPAGTKTYLANTWFTTTEWTNLVWEVIPTTDVICINICGGGNGAAEDVLVDDITVTELKAPSFDGYITNGDFETGDITGWNKWQSTEINADAAHTGSYGAHIMGNGGWGGMLDQHISIEDGKTYELSFWYKVNNGGFNWKLTGDASVTVYGSGWVTTGEWTQVTKTFVAAGDTSIFLNINGGGNGVAENAYIDDVMIKEVKDPSDDGFVKNGDFETGKDAPWTLYSGTAVSAEAAYTGNFGLHIKNPTGGWGGTAFQDFSVEIGKTYEVTMWAKNLDGARGQNIQIQNGGANVASKWFDNTNEWTLLTFEFTATATNTRINICGGGTGANEELYVDDIKVKELIDPSFDGYIYNGDFETGEVFPWDNLWGSCPTVEIVEGKDGYGLHIVSGKWNHVRQTNIAVEANTWYKVTAWAKNTSDMCLLVKDGGDSKNLVIAGVNAGDEWTEFTAVFNSGDYTTILFSLMGGENDEIAEKYGTFDNISIEVTEAPCEHEYDDCMDADCNLCGETREPGHVLTHSEAVVATNCQETGHAEYWYCENCGCYFGDAEATWQHNPGWLFTTGECVRPEDAADCAVVPCALCGNDTYGAGEHDVLICQGGTCSKCNAEIEGVGCQNYDTPACEDGVCYYCGGFVAGFGHENGAWAPCCDGECAYGCGLIYPATEDHVDADGDDYCDNCWNHLACIDADADGFCDVCWSEMPAAEIVYGDANGDGDITADDVILLQQFLAEWEVELNETGADANGDGDITADDVILLQQYLAEWDVTLGPV